MHLTGFTLDLISGNYNHIVSRQTTTTLTKDEILDMWEVFNNGTLKGNTYIFSCYNQIHFIYFN